MFSQTDQACCIIVLWDVAGAERRARVNALEGQENFYDDRIFTPGMWIAGTRVGGS
jgi:hypothetical protein